jgi:predicted Fe-Mo cluster-binding NifX family protein
VARSGAAALVTGHCGPNAFRVLSAAGIQVYTGAYGTVEDSLQAFLEGRLERAGAPDVPAGGRR